MTTTKVTLGGRLAAAPLAPGAIERHYGHDFVVQADMTLVCNMNNAFVAAELAAGRVALAAAPSEEPAVDLSATIKPSFNAKRGRTTIQVDNGAKESPPTE